MKPTAIIVLAVSVAAISAAFATEGPAGQAGTAPAPAAAESAPAKAGPEGIVEVAYALTWERDPRYRGRDPFQTVLTMMDQSAVKQVKRIAAPRTPSEESAFADRAQSLLAEAEAALDEADYATAGDRIDSVREMTTMPMVTQTAKDKMGDVSRDLAALEERYGTMRARASLAAALQLAARMQAYFETERYGEVVGADADLQALNDVKGLKNPEVAGTAALVLAKCAELKRRAEIRLEFAKQDVKVDAVSYFPEGRSFAIVNGEVLGEGALVAPELTLAAVGSGKVTFEYKGEKISRGLAEPESSWPSGKSGKEGRSR